MGNQQQPEDLDKREKQYFRYPNGDKYEGQMISFIRDGKGTYISDYWTDT